MRVTQFNSSVGWTYIISNEQAGDEQRGGMSVATETANNGLDNTVMVTKLICYSYCLKALKSSIGLRVGRL